ncbi:MAG TPA: plastocyanin/azurin family copper-binding protein [Chloroflexota bacterium]
MGAALALFLLVPIGSAFAQDADVTVNMASLSFSRPIVHIKPGQTVLWTNSDPVQHTVTADDGSFDSGVLDPGATFTQEFDTPGTYQYFCQPHGSAGLHGMAATIVVDDPNAPTTVAPDQYVPDH